MAKAKIKIELSKFLNFKLQKKFILLTCISGLAMVFMVLKTPQGFYSDAGWQLKALQQYFNGNSPTINHLVMPRTDDLSQDSAVWIWAWPPGLQLLMYPLLRWGIALGDAVRVITIFCFIFGSLGWICWFSLFALPVRIAAILAIFLPWLRYSNSAFFMFTAEIFVYASSPWVLLGAYYYNRRRLFRKRSLLIDLPAAIIFGLFFGLAYIFKYSSIFITLGALVYLWLTLFRKMTSEIKAILSMARETQANIGRKYPFYINRLTITRHGMINLFFLSLFCLVPIVSLNKINYDQGGAANLVMSKIGLHFRLSDVIFALANPALALAGLGDALSYILLHPTLGLCATLKLPNLAYNETSFLLGWLGLPGGIFLLWLILQKRVFDDLDRLATAVFLTGFVIMPFLLIISESFSDYSYQHLTPIGMCILPVVIKRGLRTWNFTRSRAIKIILTVLSIFYVAIPFIYGPVSAIAKIIKSPANYKLGPSHVYNPLLSRNDIVCARENLIQDFSPLNNIWYLTDPISALDLPGRAVIVHADFIDAEQLKPDKFSSTLPLSVWALLPPSFEKNGKGEVMRNSFLQAEKWEKIRVEGCEFTLWKTALKAKPK